MLQGRRRFVVLYCVMLVLCMIWPTYANTIPRPYINPPIQQCLPLCRVLSCGGADRGHGIQLGRRGR